MNKYRPDALTLAACAAALSLAGCSAGVTAASSTTSNPAASGRASGSLSAGSMVSVGGSIGRFPIPSGATVLENIAEGKQTLVFLASVTPQQAQSFYIPALPRAGYTITVNEMTSQKKNTQRGIKFTGHGYKGIIFATSNMSGAGSDLGSSSSGKNLVEIVLTKG